MKPAHHHYDSFDEYFLARFGCLPDEDVLKEITTKLSTKVCLLCKACPARVPFIFDTPHPEAWGGTAGTPRLLLHAVCQACAAIPDLAFRVEAALAHVMIGRAN